MVEHRYIIGIDLGTTNSVVAYRDLHEEDEKIHLFAIPQLVKEGKVEERNTLPSFLYLPGDHELAPKSISLPWDEKPAHCVGTLARSLGGKIPGRVVSSAKSWLSYPGVDRRSALLPHHAAEGVDKISPLEATSNYLEHLKSAWNHTIGKQNKAPFEQQQLFLTVPASFDVVARELTLEAAQQVDLEVTLLEEPQAAFYAWLYHHENDWRDILEVGDRVLVVDVGGGTTDFSLVSVQEEEGNLVLNREAVGEHILLGGDNMDLALAHLVSQKLPKAKLDPWQSLSLWHSCCEAKEELLADPGKDQVTVTVLGRGSRIIGGSLKAKISRKEVEEVLLDGFFPTCKADEIGNTKKVGLSEQGLPYAAEPAVNKQIAKFLQNNQSATPSAILFNGGVFKADIFQQRVLQVVSGWQEAENAKLKLLPSEDLDLAVAQGAVYYGRSKQGEGIRIRGGIPRAYYLGMESSLPAIPGVPPPMKALCVVPKGTEEGTENDIPHSELAVTVGQTVEFPFYKSQQRHDDQLGEVVDWNEKEFEQVASLETSLKPKEKESGYSIPVKLHSKVTEVGTLEIFCRSLDEEENWKLEFNIREAK